MNNCIEYYSEEIDFKKIIKSENLYETDESFFVIDLSDIINKYVVWCNLLPRVTPFYAVKCNDQQIILQVLSELGASFDCASKAEMEKVLDLNVHPDRIIFAHPIKPITHLLYAADKEVAKMTFDCAHELYKIKKYYPTAQLVLRIRCEAEKAIGPLGGKFGCDPEEDAPKLLNIAKDLGLNVIGVCFHVGSGCRDFPVYERAICLSEKLFSYGRSLGFEMNLLDIGGGFPGEKNAPMRQLSGIINRALDRYFPGDDVRIIAEPGRFFVASSHQLICKIHSIREIEHKGKVENTIYYINDGVYGSFNCVLYDREMQIPTKYILPDEDIENNQILSCDAKLNELNGIKTFNSSVWGVTCDGIDKICSDIYLPKLNVDSFLIFENMGAYSISIAVPFNGFPIAKYKYFKRKNDSQLFS